MVRTIGDINIGDFEFKACISDAYPLLWFNLPEEIFLIYISERLHYQP